MLRERDSLGMVLDRSTRVEELGRKWLEDLAGRARPRTFANYRSIVDSKIAPALGRRLVTDLTPADVRRLHATI